MKKLAAAMVSFHTPLSPTCGREELEIEYYSSKKRRLEEPLAEEISKKSRNYDHVELHLETPLPIDWQRCLDIQSGKVHFYNTRTQKRTSKDPRRSPEEPASPKRMSLDLELNLLPCDSPRKNNNINPRDHHRHNSGLSLHNSSDLVMNFGQANNNKKKDSSRVSDRRPLCLAFEVDEEAEMVATVCKKCFMLVMLCKASPACPNCKFMHSAVQDQSPPSFVKQRLRQLLY